MGHPSSSLVLICVLQPKRSTTAASLLVLGARQVPQERRETATQADADAGTRDAARHRERPRGRESLDHLRAGLFRQRTSGCCQDHERQTDPTQHLLVSTTDWLLLLHGGVGYTDRQSVSCPGP
uniref:Uncharacterized protein n=1 Tax=Arundo donax TaxID=35708 RepID=A0A0A9C3L9_ARUDO